MYEIHLNDDNNSITVTDNSINLGVNQTSNNITLTNNEHTVILTEPIDKITFTQTGKKGDKGDTGNDNLFIQDIQPVTTLDKYVWFETLGSNLKTLWVETGV